MNFQYFISRLNWRQLLIHFVAYWFFIHAFQTFSYLNNTSLVDIYRSSNEATAMKNLFNNGITTSDLVDFQFWTNSSGLIGLLVAFIISLLITIKRGWFWMNSVIVLFLTYLFYRFTSLGWTYLKQIFWFIGQAIHSTKWEFTSNGAILLIIGAFIFFFPKTNRFIENRKLETT